MKLRPFSNTLLLLFVGACAANRPLWQNGDGAFVPASGSVAPTVLCRYVSVSLRLDSSAPEPAPPKLIGSPSPCPNRSTFNGYLRSTLFVEGLDSRGARLFVATGNNPLHQDLEAPPPPSGGQFSWHAVDTKMPVVTTLIQAPVTPALVRLRWFDVDENNRPRLLGETEWPGN